MFGCTQQQGQNVQYSDCNGLNTTGLYCQINGQNSCIQTSDPEINGIKRELLEKLAVDQIEFKCVKYQNSTLSYSEIYAGKGIGNSSGDYGFWIERKDANGETIYKKFYVFDSFHDQVIPYN
ncbi:MAG: hypothetical protein Q7R70_01900 [Candidatus Diapherotrites archaeon]|nr:hypothetical protein [Candidatus Diapherotrites archaeon]